MVAPAQLPLHKGLCILNDKAGVFLRDAAEVAVFLGPEHHALGRVHVGDVGPRRRAGQRGPAGIGKQVQHSGLALPAGGGTNLLLHKGPVGSLFREKARVLEARGTHVELQPVQTDGPLIRQFFPEIPMPAAGLGAGIGSLRLLPQFRPGLGPDHLRVGPAQQNLPPPFQLFPVAGIQHFVVPPLIAKIHVFLLQTNGPGRAAACPGQ